MHIDKIYELFLQQESVQTDTRKLKKGDIFFALKGENFNGNQFVQQAFDNGASYCICDEDTGITDDRIIYTDNCLLTLQKLARKHREQFNIPFVAVTGSNGKTTTKELIHAVLSTTFKCYTTEGNLNNHIGIPLTILKIKKDAAIAVIEMGANHQKEIEGYCEYAQPTHGLITNCGKAHLEGFGGYEGVLKGKGELYDYIRKNNGTIFMYNDYDYLSQLAEGMNNIITYGTTDADITGRIANDEKLLEVTITKGAAIGVLKTNLVGGYNLPNVLAAVCIGKHFGVTDDKIQSALEHYVPSNSRSQLIEKNGNKIILDAYNANPSSMKAAIENLQQMPGNDKILILGSMRELGPESDKEHDEIVNLINKYQWHKVVLTGDGFKTVPAYAQHFTNSTEVKDWFIQQNFKDATILIKGSRGMQMEKVLE